MDLIPSLSPWTDDEPDVENVDFSIPTSCGTDSMTVDPRELRLDGGCTVLQDELPFESSLQNLLAKRNGLQGHVACVGLDSLTSLNNLPSFSRLSSPESTTSQVSHVYQQECARDRNVPFRLFGEIEVVRART